MSKEVAVIEHPESASLVRSELEQPGALRIFVADAIAMMEGIRELQRSVLREGVDFGTIPGTPKPTLYKSGAETLLAAFRLTAGDPQVEERDIDHEVPGHVEYTVRIPIINRATGQAVGYGIGSCSTMESKYRFRDARRSCPECGTPAIGRSKPEWGGGWYCGQKQGGCGAKFDANDPMITDQVVGQVENLNPADQRNTALKMAKKRALVDGALTTTAASGVFTQDVEDLVDNGVITPTDKPASNGAAAANTGKGQGSGSAASNGAPEARSAVVEEGEGIYLLEAVNGKEGQKGLYASYKLTPAKGESKFCSQFELGDVLHFLDLLGLDSQNFNQQSKLYPKKLVKALIEKSRDGRYLNIVHIKPYDPAAESQQRTYKPGKLDIDLLSALLYHVHRVLGGDHRDLVKSAEWLRGSMLATVRKIHETGRFDPPLAAAPEYSDMPLDLASKWLAGYEAQDDHTAWDGNLPFTVESIKQELQDGSPPQPPADSGFDDLSEDDLGIPMDMSDNPLSPGD